MLHDTTTSKEETRVMTDDVNIGPEPEEPEATQGEEPKQDEHP